MILESERLHTKRDASWLFCGDCRSMHELPDESVQCVVTSPPYWGLRKYTGEQDLIWDDGWRGAYGAEPTPEMYIQHTIEILREIRRVLRKDGVVWWNIGDAYVGGGRGDDVLKTKDLCLIPFRLAIALQKDDWWVRSTPIWNKPNAMPEAVNGWRWERHRIKIGGERKHNQPASIGVDDGRRDSPGGFQNASDPTWQECPGCPKCSPNDGYILRRGSWRPTEAHEFILMLTKSASYYCDKEAVAEPLQDSSMSRYKYPQHISKLYEEPRNIAPGELQNTRNLRSIWAFPTESGSSLGKHFATFPQRLPEICIKAATPEVGCCSKCGAPWARIVKKGFTSHEGHTDSAYEKGTAGNRISRLRQASRASGEEYVDRTETLGWRPTCKCNADRVPSIVLDPLVGTGTTLLVAEELGCFSVGYDLSRGYCDMAAKRLEEERKAPRRRRGTKKGKRELTPEDRQVIVARLRAGKEKKRQERGAQDVEEEIEARDRKFREEHPEDPDRESVIILKPRRK